MQSGQTEKPAVIQLLLLPPTDSWLVGWLLFPVGGQQIEQPRKQRKEQRKEQRKQETGNQETGNQEDGETTGKQGNREKGRGEGERITE